MRLPSSWNLAVLTTGCVIVGATFGVVLGVAIGGVLAPPVTISATAEPWLKTYQGLVGSVIGAVISIGAAIAAAAVAIRNVLRQMRINLMIREEDRMEELMPGIVDAAFFLRRLELRLQADPRQALNVLEAHGLKGDIQAAVRKKMKSSEGRVQQQSAWIIERIVVCADTYSQMRNTVAGAKKLIEGDNPDDADRARERLPGLEGEERERLEALKGMISRLRVYSEELMERARTYQKRLPEFRSEIEQYFASGGGSKQD